MFALVALAAIVCAACGPNAASQARNTASIHGLLTREPHDSGTAAGAPSRASVTCDGVSKTVAADGTFALSVPLARSYTCVASSPPAYAPQTVDIPSSLGSDIVLNFEGNGLSQCVALNDPPAMECGELRLLTGSVHGVVTAGGSALAGARVDCRTLGDAASAVADAGAVDWPSTLTDAHGAYTLKIPHPGHLGCVAFPPTGNAVRQEVDVAPGADVSLNFQVCVRGCSPVRFHGGDVMHSYAAYLIFWLPPGYTFDPGRGNGGFESLIQRYLGDLNGSPFYGLLTQYWDYAGNVQNGVKLAGVWSDATPYQHCDGSLACRSARATRDDPLLDTDIRSEVLRAVRANPGWLPGPDAEFIVLTGVGAEECWNSPGGAYCTYSRDNTAYCAYHSAFEDYNGSLVANFGVASGDTAIYAYLPSAAQHSCTLTSWVGASGPNRDPIADATISTLSHEQFESVTDPVPTNAQGTSGWFEDGRMVNGLNLGEVGDKCDTAFGSIGRDGGNVTLNGHRYLVQAEWSNRARGCAFS